MAAFNTAPQEIEPKSYIGLSKPIETPRPDTSKEQLLKGIGEVGSGIIKDTDKVVGQYAEGVSYRASEGLDTQRVEELKGVARQMNLIPQGEPEDTTPDGVNRGIKTANSLVSARENGVITDTYYRMARDKMAKDLKTQFPGYWDQIHQGLAKAENQSTANELAKSLQTNINASIEKHNAERNKTENILIKGFEAGWPHMDTALAAFKAGKMSEGDALGQYYQTAQQKYQFEFQKQQLEAYKGNRELEGMKAGDAMTGAANSTVSSSINNLRTSTGDSVVDIVNKAAMNPGSVPGEVSEQLAPMLAAEENKARANLIAQFNQPDKDGRTLAQKYGETKTKELIDNSMAQFKQYREAVTNKEYGVASAAARGSKALTDGVMYDAVKTWPQVAILKAFTDAGGPNFAQTMYQSNIITGDLKAPDKASVEQLGMRMLGQPTLQDNGGKVWTMKNSVDAAVTSKASPPAVAQILSLPKLIARNDVSPQQKENIASATFSPENWDLLSNIDMDSKDAKGNPIRGRYAVFQDYTSPEVAKGLQQLGNSKVLNNWKDWSEKTFAKDLFGKDIGDLASFTTEPGVTIEWHNGSKGEPLGFFVKSSNTTRSNDPSQPYYGSDRVVDPVLKRMQLTLDRLNGGINSLNNVYKTTGADVNARILQMFISAGYDPSKLKGDIPSEMIKAMKYSSEKSFPEPVTAKTPAKEIKHPKMEEHPEVPDPRQARREKQDLEQRQVLEQQARDRETQKREDEIRKEERSKGIQQSEEIRQSYEKRLKEAVSRRGPKEQPEKDKQDQIESLSQKEKNLLGRPGDPITPAIKRELQNVRDELKRLRGE